MDPVTEIVSLQKKIKEIENQKNRKEGALLERKRSMQEMFETSDVSEAKKILGTMMAKRKELEAQLTKQLSTFKEAYGGLLN